MNSFLLKLSLLALVSLGAGFTHSWVQGASLNTSLSDVLKDRPASTKARGGDPVTPPGKVEPTTPNTGAKTPPESNPASASNNTNPNTKSLGGDSKTIPTPPVTPSTHDHAKENDISLADAFSAYSKQDGQTFFIDAREPHEYQASHIAGAMNLSPTMVARGMPQKALENLRDMPLVIIYCGGGDCHASEDVAIKLAQAIKSIGSFKILHAGFPAWTQANHPTESGADPY